MSRWQYRFQNFQKSLKRLQEAIEIIERNPGDFLRMAGLIQTYEFCFELGWKTLKDYLTQEGHDVPSPRKTIRTAFESNIIQDGKTWISALEDRNKTAHTYDEGMALDVIQDITHKYFPVLKNLEKFLTQENEKLGTR